MSDIKHILFVCSRNQWRSPTAERVWREHSHFQTRSAGTSPRAKKTVSPADIRWADIILVMEKKHKNRLKAQYDRLLQYKPIHILDIEDNYQFMDEELVKILISQLEQFQLEHPSDSP